MVYHLYYYSRLIAISLSILLLMVDWQLMLPIVVSGWLICFILYNYRGVFNRYGLARYYVYSLLFYSGILLAFWCTSVISENFLALNLSTFTSSLTVIQAETNFFAGVRFLSAIWGISYGVVIYLLIAELGGLVQGYSAVRELTPSNPEVYSPDLMIICSILCLLIVAVIWSWELATATFIYILIAYHLDDKIIRWLDLLLLIVFIFSLWLNIFIIPLWVLIPLFLMRVVVNFKFKQSSVTMQPVPYAHMPAAGVFLGNHYFNDSPVVITDKESNQHTLIMGTTGAGKTTVILNYVEHCAQNGYPCIFLDGKGSIDLVEKLLCIANKYGRVFKFFTLKPHLIDERLKGCLSSYNPFGSGTATEWKNRIMALFAQAEGRGQQHFALLEETMVNSMVNILQRAGGKLNLKQLLAFMQEPELLQYLAGKIGDSVLIQQARQIKEDGQSIAKDVIAFLELFIYSSYGMLFDPQQFPNMINLKQTIANGEIVLFLFDASAYKSDTEKVAKMVINDINSSFAELSSPITAYAVFDEFASYASSNLSDTISLQRSNGLHAIVGTQSITTVGLKSPETQRVAEELLACCNTYILLAINHDKDIERMAKLFGTRKAPQITTYLNNSQVNKINSGTSRIVDEFLVHPQQIRTLKTGEAFIYRKAAGISPFKLRMRIKIHPCSRLMVD